MIGLALGVTGLCLAILSGRRWAIIVCTLLLIANVAVFWQ